MKKIIWSIALAVLLNGVATAENTSSNDNEAITKTALDYIEGWYAGDGARWKARFIPNWPSA